MLRMNTWIPLLLIAAWGCAAPKIMTYPGTQDPTRDYYIVKVDSLEIPAAGTALRQRVIARGIIGNDGCHRLEQVDTTHKGYQVHVTFWGSKPKEKQICTQALVPLKYEFSFPSVAADPTAGVNAIVVHQPDGSTMLRAF
jgi:hypothetical protein